MASTGSPLRLAHGWTLVRGPSLSAALVRQFIRPAVRAVPSSMAERLGSCRISLPAESHRAWPHDGPWPMAGWRSRS